VKFGISVRLVNASLRSVLLDSFACFQEFTANAMYSMYQQMSCRRSVGMHLNKYNALHYLHSTISS